MILLAAVVAAMCGSAAPLSSAQRKPTPRDCLLYVTVFNPEGYALFGAEGRIHPVDKKKPHWEETSDHAGEFAVRVPPDGDYEIEVKAKGFISQTRKVTPEESGRLDIVFRMVQAPGKKP